MARPFCVWRGGLVVATFVFTHRIEEAMMLICGQLLILMF